MASRRVRTRHRPRASTTHRLAVVWAFLERWAGRLTLQGVAKGDPRETMNAIDDAFGEARAAILDVHFFSGVHIAIHFEVDPSSVLALEGALARAGVVLDPSCHAAIVAAASSEHVIPGSLAVTFAHGDPDVRHEIPKVPG